LDATAPSRAAHRRHRAAPDIAWPLALRLCWPRGRLAGAAAVLLPVVALGFYGSLLATRMRSMVEHGVLWNSDAVGAMVTTDALASQAHHGPVYFPTRTPYATLLVDALTRWLPDHRLLWVAWPYLAYVAAMLLLGLTVRRIAGRRAAVISAAVALASAPLVLVPYAAQEFHGLSAETAVVLAALLVLLAQGGRTRVLAPLAAGVGLLTGLEAASDHLTVVIGVLPFISAAVLLLWCWRDRAAVRMVGLAGLTLATALATAAVAVAVGQQLGARDHGMPVQLIGTSGAPHQLGVLGSVAAALFGAPAGYGWSNTTGRPELLAGLAICAVVAAGLAGALYAAMRSASRLRDARTAAAVRRRGLTAHVLVWVVIAAATVAMIMTTDLAADVTGIRYSLVLWPAVAALIGLPALSSRRAALAASFAAAALVAANAHAIAGVDAAHPVPDLAARALGVPRADAVVADLTRTLRAERVRKAYVGYWLSDSVTWATHGAIQARPAFQSGTYCDSADPARLCATTWYSLDDWYQPQAGRCAVVVTAGASPAAAPSAAYGTPIAVDHVDMLTVYVYAHDIGPLPTTYNTQRG
jgi:hypothetical protein